MTEQIVKAVLILLGRSCGIGFTPSLWQEGRVRGREKVLSLNAMLCPQDRAFLPCKVTSGDRLEVRAVLKLLQWQHELNQTPNLRRMDVPLCYFSFSPLLVLCSPSICRIALRLCVLLSLCCSLYFQAGVCIDSDMIK